MAKYPQSNFGFKRSRFKCVECGRRKSNREYLTISAYGGILSEKGQGYEKFNPADITELCLSHVMDLSKRTVSRLELAVGRGTGQANVVLCSPKCLRSYLAKAVDELERRTRDVEREDAKQGPEDFNKAVQRTGASRSTQRAKRTS